MRDIPRPLLIIILGAVNIRLVLLFLIIMIPGSDFLFAGDSMRFYQPAINLLVGNGFSQNETPPFMPHADFPPVYSLLIAGSLFISGSIFPLIVLQILLSSLIPLLVWRMGDFLGLIKSDRTKILAATLTAFEPQMILWSLLLITEVPAIFFLTVAVYFFLKTLAGNSLKDAAFSGMFLALSTLTRPHAQFLFLASVVFLVWVIIVRRLGGRNFQGFIDFRVKSAMAFMIIFVVVLSPWILRNYYHFGTFIISTTGLRNLYSGVGTSVMAFKTGKPYNDIQEELHATFREKYGYTREDIYENPAIGPLLAKEGFKIVLDNPKESLGAFTVILNSFFMQDLYLDNARKFGIIPYFSFGFSPSLVLVKDGPLKLISLIKERIGWYAIIPVVGKMFWISVNILMVVGLVFAFRGGNFGKVSALLFLFLIIYYAFINLAAGFSDQGRLRYAINPYMFLLASYGLLVLKSKFRYPAEIKMSLGG